MEKSYNDINAQVQRCIALANEIGGRWTANAQHRADVQYFAQIGRRVKTQRGIPVFCADNDRKYPLKISVRVKQEQQSEPIAVIERAKPVKTTPTEQAHNRVAFNDWMSSDEHNRKRIQNACRHRFINKMYGELLTDMEICKLENWDVQEFPRMVRDALAVCFPKQPKQLTLF